MDQQTYKKRYTVAPHVVDLVPDNNLNSQNEESDTAN